MAQRLSTYRTALGAVVVLCGLAWALSAQAQQAGRLYRYVDENGRVHYTDRPPEQAPGQAVDQLNRQGMVVKHVDPPPTPEQMAEREAAKKKKEEAEQRERDQKRRDETLRGRYASESDIELARKDAITGLETTIRGAESRIADLSKREKRARAEAARYPADKVPQTVTDELAGITQEISAQRELVAKKQSEITAVNARYDEDKRRYAELTGRSGAAPAATK